LANVKEQNTGTVQDSGLDSGLHNGLDISPGVRGHAKLLSSNV